MLRKKLKLSSELPCCKLCCINDTCTKKFFVDAFECQKEYNDLISIYTNSRHLGIARSKIIDILSNEDIIFHTEYRDLRKKNRR